MQVGHSIIDLAWTYPGRCGQLFWPFWDVFSLPQSQFELQYGGCLNRSAATIPHFQTNYILSMTRTQWMTLTELCWWFDVAKNMDVLLLIVRMSRHVLEIAKEQPKPGISTTSFSCAELNCLLRYLDKGPSVSVRQACPINTRRHHVCLFSSEQKWCTQKFDKSPTLPDCYPSHWQ